MPPPSYQINKSKVVNQSSNLIYPEDLGDNALIMVFKTYKYESPGDRKLLRMADGVTARIGDTITLPIPTNLNDTYSVRLLRPEGGVISDAIAGAAAGSGANASSDVGGIFTGIQNSMLGMMMSEKDMAAVMSGDFSTLSSNARFLTQMMWRDGSWGGAIDRGHGTVINPKAALTFEGVDMKNHSFEWHLMPRSANESSNIRDIIHTLKRNMLPAYMNAAGVRRALMKYPSMVDLYFVGVDPSYYYYFKTCMIQSVTASYGDGDALGIVEGGRPATVMLSLQLAETDVHSSSDYGGEGESDAVVTGLDVRPGRQI